MDLVQKEELLKEILNLIILVQKKGFKNENRWRGEVIPSTMRKLLQNEHLMQNNNSTFLS